MSVHEAGHYHRIPRVRYLRVVGNVLPRGHSGNPAVVAVNRRSTHTLRGDHAPPAEDEAHELQKRRRRFPATWCR